MTQLPKPLPKLFRLVEKPDNAPGSEILKALPIYIEGLEELTGNGQTAHTHTIPEIVGLAEFVLNHEQDSADYDRRIAELETQNTALSARIEALEGD